MSEQIADHIKAMIKIGRQIVDQNPELNQETGDINSNGDRSIGMDIRLEDAFVDYLKDQKIPCNVFAEERGMIDLHPDPEYFVEIDPLDGSTNYKLGNGLLPYGSLIAFYKGVNPKIKDVVAAGFIEYTRNLAWIYVDGKTTTLEGEEVKIKDDWVITPSTPIYLDLFRNAQKFSAIQGSLFVRNEGSTSGNLSLVLSSIAAGTGSACMKPEEIGAVCALVKGAGGLVVNHQGQDMADESFDPDRSYEILVGSPKVIELAVSLLKT